MCDVEVHLGQTERVRKAGRQAVELRRAGRRSLVQPGVQVRIQERGVQPDESLGIADPVAIERLDQALEDMNGVADVPLGLEAPGCFRYGVRPDAGRSGVRDLLGALVMLERSIRLTATFEQQASRLRSLRGKDLRAQAEVEPVDYRIRNLVFRA